MKRLTLYLVILIPAASVAMGIVNLYFAFSDPDPVVRLQAPPLGKTSWRDTVPADRETDTPPVRQQVPAQR
ncbi:MAG: hypothetical protein R3E82_07725 [Pseudomonadales bacterium]